MHVGVHAQPHFFLPLCTLVSPILFLTSRTSRTLSYSRCEVYKHHVFLTKPLQLTLITLDLKKLNKPYNSSTPTIAATLQAAIELLFRPLHALQRAQMVQSGIVVIRVFLVVRVAGLLKLSGPCIDYEDYQGCLCGSM